MFTITYFLFLPGVENGVLSNTTVTVGSASLTAFKIAVSNAALAVLKSLEDYINTEKVSLSTF